MVHLNSDYFTVSRLYLVTLSLLLYADRTFKLIPIFFYFFFWFPYMAINVSVQQQYNGGFLPETYVITLILPCRGFCPDT